MAVAVTERFALASLMIFDMRIALRELAAAGAGQLMPTKPHRVLLDRVSGYADEAAAYLRRRRHLRKPFARTYYAGGRSAGLSRRLRARARALFVAASRLIEVASQPRRTRSGRSERRGRAADRRGRRGGRSSEPWSGAGISPSSSARSATGSRSRSTSPGSSGPQSGSEQGAGIRVVRRGDPLRACRRARRSDLLRAADTLARRSAATEPSPRR